jgi:hypothetical protein
MYRRFLALLSKMLSMVEGSAGHVFIEALIAGGVGAGGDVWDAMLAHVTLIVR